MNKKLLVELITQLAHAPNFNLVMVFGPVGIHGHCFQVDNTLSVSSSHATTQNLCWDQSRRLAVNQRATFRGVEVR